MYNADLPFLLHVVLIYRRDRRVIYDSSTLFPGEGTARRYTPDLHDHRQSSVTCTKRARTRDRWHWQLIEWSISISSLSLTDGLGDGLAIVNHDRITPHGAAVAIDRQVLLSIKPQHER